MMSDGSASAELSGFLYAPLTNLSAVVAGDGPVASGCRQLLRELGATVVDQGELSGLRGGAADIAIVDAIALEGVASWLDADALLPQSSCKVRVVVTAFGLEGPKSGGAANEWTLQAVGGLAARSWYPDSERPGLIGGSNASMLVATAAVLAALHGEKRRRVSGDSQDIDVSAQEAVIFQGPYLELLHALMRCSGPPGSGRFRRPAGWYRCTPGELLVLTFEDRHRVALERLLGAPETAGADEVTALLTRWSLERSALEAEQELQAVGVPATAVNDQTDLEAAGYRVTTSDAADAQTLPAVVVPLGEPDFRSPAGSSGSEAGDRANVVVLGSVLAVPMAGAILGAMGERVLRVEEPGHLDVYRRIGPFIDGRPHVDNGAYFAGVNHSVASVLISPVEEPERWSNLLAGADIVIHNLNPKTAGHWQVRPDDLAAAGFTGLVIASSGHSPLSPRSGHRAYAYNIHASAGLCRVEQGSERLEIRSAFADMATGVSIALLSEAWALRGESRGTHVSIAMTDLLISRTMRKVAEADSIARAIVWTTDSRWNVMSWPMAIENDISEAVGCRESLGPAMKLGLSSGELEVRITAAGGACAAVLSPAELLVDPHLAARGYFCAVPHPEAETCVVPGLPWVFRNNGRPALSAVERLGATRDWKDEDA